MCMAWYGVMFSFHQLDAFQTGHLATRALWRSSWDSFIPIKIMKIYHCPGFGTAQLCYLGYAATTLQGHRLLHLETMTQVHSPHNAAEEAASSLTLLASRKLQKNATKRRCLGFCKEQKQKPGASSLGKKESQEKSFSMAQRPLVLKKSSTSWSLEALRFVVQGIWLWAVNDMPPMCIT